MCGIFCSFLAEPEAQNNFQNNINSSVYCNLRSLVSFLLKNRGPDLTNLIKLENFIFEGHVLWQQGVNPCPQPLHQNNNVLLFNGDIFMEREFPNESDTVWLFKKLCSCKTDDDIIELFKTIKGPYSIIFFNSNIKKLWFARDSIGRNSLLIGRYNHEIFLSSAINLNIQETEHKNFNIIELPPLGLYCGDFIDISKPKFKLFPWVNLETVDLYKNQLSNVEVILNKNIIVSKTIKLVWMNFLQSQDEEHKSYNFHEILQHCTDNEDIDKLFLKLLDNEKINKVVDKLISLLKQSTKERITNTPAFCRKCLEYKINSQTEICCKHTKVGVLFSGGLDCSILAVLADKFIEKEIPIDLINVAFEECLRKQHANPAKSWNYLVPDRKTALETIDELRKILPDRTWNLVEVNIGRDELEQYLHNNICYLINPLQTVLDESLGAALWFAARCQGIVNNVPYRSPCRVLLLGSGADELFAGYSRHRKAYVRGVMTGDSSLKDELEIDWQRLPSRNLARDDRVISDHGITPRTPYLQEDLIKFIRSLEPLEKCYLKLPSGVGDKLLLRLCAYKLNLRKSCCFKKRALQFGSRIADNKQNGNDISMDE